MAGTTDIGADGGKGNPERESDQLVSVDELTRKKRQNKCE